MASPTAQSAPASPGPGAGGPARKRGVSFGGDDGLLSRVLALREGSIVVVTVIVGLYFALNTSSFFTSRTSRRCCRTSRRSRSSARARFS